MNRYILKSIVISLVGILFLSTLLAQPTIAVMPFQSKNPDKGYNFSELLSIELFEIGTYQIVERSNMDKIIAEHALSLSGLTKESNITVGRLLGAEYFVYGNIIENPDSAQVIITAKMVDVESGSVVGMGYYEVSVITLGTDVQPENSIGYSQCAATVIAKQLLNIPTKKHRLDIVIPWKTVLYVFIIIIFLGAFIK